MHDDTTAARQRYERRGSDAPHQAARPGRFPDRSRRDGDVPRIHRLRDGRGGVRSYPAPRPGAGRHPDRHGRDPRSVHQRGTARPSPQGPPRPGRTGDEARQTGNPMRNVTLNNGVAMPILGFGVYQIAPERTEQAVSEALAVGYRLLDTAAAYGNEEAVGRAIKSSGIARGELFVTTKLWIQDAPAQQNTRRAFETSLTKLGLDYLDLYLMHQPYGDVYGQWRAMEELTREGRAKAIGVANFHPDRLIDLIVNNDVTPAVDQIETHPFFQRIADQELMRAHRVRIQSWGGFAEGRNNLFTHPLLSEIADKHGKSVAQVVLRWLTQRGVIAIPKSVHAERMAENIDIFDFELTDEQMAAIATLETGASLFFDHRDPEMVAWLAKRRLDA
ncbi:aldo/keto reductase [Embleya sp. NPDC008237]|uniref:aldo/keto reductase n=1 Tax=Embleya sp. NPDC008237 TaxID=3363978 RepID=UPI0037046C44